MHLIIELLVHYGYDTRYYPAPFVGENYFEFLDNFSLECSTGIIEKLL